MTGSVRGALVNALADHALDSDYCRCGWRMSPDFGTREDWGAHLADVLLGLSGVAVIQLPAAEEPEDWGAVAAFDGFVVQARTDRPIETVWGEEIDAEDARHYAVCLLAAAVVAEQHQESD